MSKANITSDILAFAATTAGFSYLGFKILTPSIQFLANKAPDIQPLLQGSGEFLPFAFGAASSFLFLRYLQSIKLR